VDKLQGTPVDIHNTSYHAISQPGLKTPIITPKSNMKVVAQQGRSIRYLHIDTSNVFTHDIDSHLDDCELAGGKELLKRCPNIEELTFKYLLLGVRVIGLLEVILCAA
jgi:hypothetical protein